MRETLVTVDEYGVDPLGDNTDDIIGNLSPAIKHTIGPGEALNPWLLAYDVYGSVEYFFVVLGYNNMGSIYDFTEGTEITLPSASSVKRALAQRNEAKARTVAI